MKLPRRQFLHLVVRETADWEMPSRSAALCILPACTTDRRTAHRGAWGGVQCARCCPWRHLSYAISTIWS